MPAMQGRNVLVTGGGGGLGLDVTAACVEAGAKVTATVYRGSEPQALADRLGDRIDDVKLVPADLRDPEAVAGVVAAMPGVDALVHLAGGFSMGDTASFGVDEYRNLVDINLTTTFLAVRAVLGPMRDAGYGRIVTVSSRSAVEPSGQLAAYAATKAAVLAFTRAVADEHRDANITANTVLPSIIDTPANRAAMGETDAHRWVTPTNLARSIVFLASEAAGDLRGSAVRVYGGA